MSNPYLTSRQATSSCCGEVPANACVYSCGTAVCCNPQSNENTRENYENTNCYPPFRTIFDRDMQNKHSDCCLPGKFDPCFPQTTDQETEKFILKGGPGRFIPGRVAPSITLKLIPHEKNVQDGDLNLPRAMRSARERRVDSFNAQLDCFAGSNDPRCRDVEHFGRKRPDGGIDGLGNLSKRRSLGDAYTGHSLCSIM